VDLAAPQPKGGRVTDPLSNSDVLSDYEDLSVDPSTQEVSSSVGITPSPTLIRATVKSLTFSNGSVVVIANLKPEECERLAVEMRAETGVVPYGLWVVLTDKARAKLSGMTMAMARWMRSHE